MGLHTLHDGPERLKDCLGCKVFGWYEIYKVLLPPLLTLDDIIYGRIGGLEGCR